MEWTGWSAGSSKGRITVKVEPASGTLSTVISPPIRSTRRRQMASPSPVPPKRRVVETSAWLKGVNRPFSVSGAMPMPLSAIVKASRRGAAFATSTRTDTRPRCSGRPEENLMALPTRL